MESKGAEAPSRTRAIAERLGEVLGEPLVGEVRRLSSGASRDTFAFCTRSRGSLVVQIAREGEKLVQSPPQAALFAAAAEAGVPVPRVVVHGDADAVLGPSWTVLEALPGTTDPKPILAGDGVPDAARLLDDLAGALAAIHRMQVDPAIVSRIEDPLALLHEWHDRLGEPHPVFELAFRVLEAARPAATRRALVHGDFRMGNLMVGASGLNGVLDWELAHVGDPVEDLGWLCVPAWRFTRPDRPAAGLGAHEQLLAAYERHAGLAVDPSVLRWWELAGTVRWGVICVMQAFAHLSGARSSVEHAVIGRRACEVEWDLLELLDPPPGTGATPRVAPAAAALRAATPEARIVADRERAASPALHDRPTAVELLEAARGALGDEVLPHLHGRPAFQLRVVLRALGIVRRELSHLEQHAALHAAALAAVGCSDEQELGRAIREGRLSEQDELLLAALRVIVRAKLEAANPSYLGKTERQREEQ